ncbi:hypothetical protein [Sulfurimonas sp.]|uniref:c-type cytochrome n=1 Tax=Sulfurimonas sp. TaxID=2022749 RepID=UPI002B4619E8|nr:hypothetical protein [Sulfurimonas sp.]
MKKNKINTLAYAVGLLTLIMISGCSDSNETKNTNKINSSNVVTTSKIEIVKNENAHAIKVEEKEADKSQEKSYYYDYNIKSAYDQNAQPANEDASVRVKPRTSVEANMNIRSPYQSVRVSNVKNNLSLNFRVKCSACHSDYANGVVGPSLLGKDSDYIYKKIIEFKTNKDKNVLMSDLVKMMDEKEIREIANEIFEFNKQLNNGK